MKKIKYYYNTHTLRYEKYEDSLQARVLRVVGFISAVAVFAFVIVYLAYTYLDSPKEKQLKRELSDKDYQLEIMNSKLDQMTAVLTDLQDRDDNIYRVIFEAEPIPKSIRNSGFGGSAKFKELMTIDNNSLLLSTAKKLSTLRNKLYIQSKSYDEIEKMVKGKQELLAAIPAIQPISNKRLTRIGMGFGYGIDPIYKTAQMHPGIDFDAPSGTPIYATGDGVVEKAEWFAGYGNCVMIRHGYGYESLYGHMSRIKVHNGQKVKRGEQIGWVGSTGRSTGPHCHYEVIKNGAKVNPIYYFFNDLSPTEYQQLVELAESHKQSAD